MSKCHTTCDRNKDSCSTNCCRCPGDPCSGKTLEEVIACYKQYYQPWKEPHLETCAELGRKGNLKNAIRVAAFKQTALFPPKSKISSVFAKPQCRHGKQSRHHGLSQPQSPSGTRDRNRKEKREVRKECSSPAVAGFRVEVPIPNSQLPTPYSLLCPVQPDISIVLRHCGSGGLTKRRVCGIL